MDGRGYSDGFTHDSHYDVGVRRPLYAAPSMNTTTDSVPQSYVMQNMVSPQAKFQAVLQSEEVAPLRPALSNVGTRVKGKSGSTGFWIIEYLACLLAILAFIATVIVLKVYDGKPLPQWPASISINTVVSIFTSILKAAIAIPICEGLSELKWMWYSKPRPVVDLDHFDSATRGPWGSLKFIVRFPLSNKLASLAALITIIALAVDPFTQQILRYSICTSIQSSATVPVVRTNAFDNVGTRLGPGRYQLDPFSIASLYRGLLNPPDNATADLTPFCPTGNCTFSGPGVNAYSSLGMCATVSDISSQITTQAQASDGSGFVNSQYSLPSGPLIGNDIFLSMVGIGVNETGQDNQPLYAFDTLLTNLSQSKVGSYNVWAFRTSINPCVRTYSNVNVSNSVFYETISSPSNLSWIDSSQAGGVADMPYFSLVGAFPSLPGIDCTPSTTPVGNKTLATSALDNGSRYAGDSGALLTVDGNTMYFDPGCSYGMSWYSHVALQGSLSTDFFGNQSVTIEEGETAGSNGGFIGQPWILRLHDQGNATLANVAKYMDGLADALTVNMRQHGSALNSSAAMGDVLQAQTCVTVRWAWLSLPALLLGLTVAFLVAVSARSALHLRRQGRGAWKSSSLPLVWCGLQDVARSAHGRLDTVDDMQELSDRINARLQTDHAGYSDYPPDGSKAGGWALKEE